MDKITNKAFFPALFFFLLMFFTVGYVGSLEFAEDVVSGMSDRQYREVLKDMGMEKASDRKVADYYLKYREKYDSIR